MTPDNVLYTLFCRADGSAEIAMELSHKSQKKVHIHARRLQQT